MQFENVADNGGYRVVRAGSVLIGYLYHQMEVADLQLSRACMMKHHELYPRFSMITLVAPTVKMHVAPDVRTEASKMAETFGKLAIGSAVVVRSGSFGVTIIRLFVAANSLLTSTPQRMFVSLEESLEWLSKLPGQDPEVAKLDAKSIQRHLGEAA